MPFTCLAWPFPGWILIDRCGKHFGSILTYLREEAVTLPPGRQAVLELLAEAKYYLIQGLVELCQGGLQVSDTERDVCHKWSIGLWTKLWHYIGNRVLRVQAVCSNLQIC